VPQETAAIPLGIAARSYLLLVLPGVRGLTRPSREREYDPQPSLGARPEFLDHVASGTARDISDRDRDQNRIVELSSNGNEVRYKVERHHQVQDEQSEHDLGPPRYPIVSNQTLEEHDAVRKEARDLTSILSATE
jgi:hypothetical protein